MNTKPPSQHETLSHEELELARVVRALPGGEPPPALDAFILKAASDAVASSHPSKKSLWGKGLLGTSALWLGTAAASVLTVGIGWQVFQSMRAPIYELPADENISSVQEIDESHKDDSLIVEMEPAREPLPTSPPAPEPFAESDQAVDAAAYRASADKPKAMVAEKRERQEIARQQIANEMADDAFAKKTDGGTADMRRDQSTAGADLSLQAAEAVAPASAPAPPPMPVGAIAPAVSDSAKGIENKEIYTVTVPATRIKRDEEESNAPAQARSLGYGKAKLNTAIVEDSKLSPELWLYAIRDRVKLGDIDGAKASLKLFQETYPKRRIPEDLKPLLK